MKRRRFVKGATLVLVLTFVTALFSVGVRIEVIQTGYRLRSLEEESERLKAENHALTVEWATLRSPRRLGERARELGLVRPREDQVTLLSANPW